jgi:dihydrofolate synthase/folylpolyglutamate synthase
LPEIVLDVAHNPAGAWALRSALSSRYLRSESTIPLAGSAAENEEGETRNEKRLTFLFGAMRDKAIAEITSILFPLAQHVVATRAANPRSAPPGEIQSVSHRTMTDIALSKSVSEGVEHACNLAGQEGVVVITGSIYVVGEAMAWLRERRGTA